MPVPVSVHRTADALARAVVNDHRHVVSADDANKIVDAAVADIRHSDAPRMSLVAAERYVDAARRIVGADADAVRALDRFPARGQGALALRLAELAADPARPAALPDDAQRSFQRMLADHGLAAAGQGASISDVKREGDAFSFKYAASGAQGTAWARLDGARWLFTPQKLSSSDLQKVKDAAKAWFDSDFAPEMRQWGASEAEIASARAAFVPVRALLPGEVDPYDFAAQYPLVFQIDNASGSDHGVYAGFDPESGDAELYAFN